MWWGEGPMWYSGVDTQCLVLTLHGHLSVSTSIQQRCRAGERGVWLLRKFSMELEEGALKKVAEAVPFIFCLGWSRKGQITFGFTKTDPKSGFVFFF